MGAPKVEKSEADAQSEQIVNGLNVGQMVGLVNEIQDTPDLALFKFRATNRWINSTHNRTTIKSLYGACREDTSRVEPFIVDADEPVSLMGRDAAPNPVEYIL